MDTHKRPQSGPFSTSKALFPVPLRYEVYGFKEASKQDNKATDLWGLQLQRSQGGYSGLRCRGCVGIQGIQHFSPSMLGTHICNSKPPWNNNSSRHQIPSHRFTIAT